MKRFDGYVVVVTGGTRGIGKAITEKFLDEGAEVIATYVSNEQAAEKLKANYPEKLTLKKFDVSNERQVQEFFQFVENSYPQLDVLVNNSGVREDGLCAALPESSWDKVIDINLKGTFLVSKHAIGVMKRNRRGRIINISSMSALLGLPGQSNYGATKAGQIALTKSLSKELGKRQITVNAIAPGFITTELIDDLTAEQKTEYLKTIPLKRFGEASDVASTVAFLASSEAAYITGTVIEVSGGLS